jgi:hypothetical protein
MNRTAFAVPLSQTAVAMICMAIPALGVPIAGGGAPALARAAAALASTALETLLAIATAIAG